MTYYHSLAAERAAGANARQIFAEVEHADAEIAARSARLAPYRGRGHRYRPGIVARILLWCARRMRGLAAAIRQHHVNR
jgi:hypothetical protein